MGHDGDSEFAHPPSTIAPGPLVPVVSVSPSPGGLPAVPELSVDNLTVLVVVTLGLSVVLALSVVLLALRLRGIRRTYARLLGGGGRNEDLLAAVTRHVAAVERLHVRVDQLSYSVALLDEAGDGIVLSAINGRAETRSYAKEVKGGQSTQNLSEEEQAAIDMALGRAKQVTIRV